MSAQRLKLVTKEPHDQEPAASNKLLDKVIRTLTEADPASWQIGGEELRPEARFMRPREYYEQVLVMPIQSGSLVLRSQQRVVSTYLPGGYALSPIGAASYSVEVRDKIYNADRIVDPKYADNQKGKRCDLVARGEIARKLFFQVMDTVKQYQTRKHRDFLAQAEELVNSLISRIEETPIDSWEKMDGDKEVQYSREFSEVKVEISRLINEEGSPNFRLLLSRDKMAIEHKSEGFARTAFQLLEELGQNAQLIALNDVLEQAGLAPDDE